MKKLRMIVLLFILAFSFSVNAKVELEIDCNSIDISSSKSVTCEGNLLYAKEGVNDISFDYQTNLDIKFTSVSGFTLTKENGNIQIHSDKTLYSKITNVAKIMEFTLSSNDKSTEKEKLLINNIMINNSSDIVVNNVTKEFNVTKEAPKLDSVCTLDSIIVEKEKVKDFNKDKLEYYGINVTEEVIFIDAERTSLKSSATGLGNVIVPKGETIERKIIVTAEDGSSNTYILHITNINREEEVILPDDGSKSRDNTLKSLELYNGKKQIYIDFDKEREIYSLEIGEEVTKLTIKAALNDSKASFVKNYGPRDIKLKYGYNKELIKIKAENGDIKVITLDINYIDNRSSDNTLSSLKINGEILDLKSNNLEIKVPSNTNKTEIEAIANDEKATIKYEDVELFFGDNNVNILVTSENGKTKDYLVHIIKENEKKILDNIIVDGYNLDFSKDKTNYNLKIDANTNELLITVNPSTVNYQILDNNNLENGSKILIKITDDEGSYEYTINIEKDIVSNSDDTSYDFICYIVFGMGIVSLVLSIIYYVKRLKQKKEVDEI